MKIINSNNKKEMVAMENSDGSITYLKKSYVDFWHEIPEEYTGVIEIKGGITVYYMNGKYHNSNGPAMLFPDGESKYFILGKEFTKKEFEQLMKERVL